MPKVLMIQYHPMKWRIETESGFVLQYDISVEYFRAEEYVRNWISSFSCWEYEMRPMKENGR